MATLAGARVAHVVDASAFLGGVVRSRYQDGRAYQLIAGLFAVAWALAWVATGVALSMAR